MKREIGSDRASEKTCHLRAMMQSQIDIPKRKLGQTKKKDGLAYVHGVVFFTTR